MSKPPNFLVLIFSLDLKIIIPYHKIVVRIRWDKADDTMSQPVS